MEEQAHNYQTCSCAECRKDKMIMDGFAAGRPYVLLDNGPDGLRVMDADEMSPAAETRGPNVQAVLVCGLFTIAVLTGLWFIMG